MKDFQFDLEDLDVTIEDLDGEDCTPTSEELENDIDPCLDCQDS